MAVVPEGRDERNRPAREPNAISNAIPYAKFYSRSHHAVIRVFDDAGNVIETHEHNPVTDTISAIASPWPCDSRPRMICSRSCDFQIGDRLVIQSIRHTRTASTDHALD
jgi:hypothetical protein